MNTDQFFSFYDSEWTELEDRQKLFSQIDPIDGLLAVGDHVAAVSRRLPMYEGVNLICLTSDKWEPNLRICYLAQEDQLFRLNGTSPPIHEVNAKAGIKLNEQNLFYYLSYFCFFVRGEEGAFYVLCDLDDKLLPEGFFDVRSKNESSVMTARQLFRRPRLIGKDDDGKWQASAVLLYSNALFHADFSIEPTGMVSMLSDEPLIPELPCRLAAPLTTTLKSL